MKETPNIMVIAYTRILMYIDTFAQGSQRSNIHEQR